jgi:hypothetical protein
MTCSQMVSLFEALEISKLAVFQKLDALDISDKKKVVLRCVRSKTSSDYYSETCLRLRRHAQARSKPRPHSEEVNRANRPAHLRFVQHKLVPLTLQPSHVYRARIVKRPNQLLCQSEEANRANSPARLRFVQHSFPHSRPSPSTFAERRFRRCQTSQTSCCTCPSGPSASGTASGNKNGRGGHRGRK